MKLTIKQRKWLLFRAEVKEMLHYYVIEIVLSQSEESCFIFLPLSPLHIWPPALEKGLLKTECLSNNKNITLQ